MPNKALPAKVKADPGATDVAGTFTAIVAAYNTDSGGDKIVPGAFGKSLAAWAESGNRIPVVWSHQHNDAFSYIGEVLEASETDDGLVIKGQLDIDDNTYAAQVYRLIKGGRINNYSFAYEVNDSEPAGKDGDGDGAHTLLKELDLIEAGPTLVGMNRATRTLDVKADTVSDKPWSGFSQADYSDQQWSRACLLDRGADAGTAKQRYGLPVREPAGALNRNGAHAAASVLGGGRGGVQAPPEAKRSAAKKLVALYRGPLAEDPPDSLVAAAKADTPAVKSVPGSFEALQEMLTDALTEQVGGMDGYAWPLATFPDHVVYRMSGPVPSDGCETYSAPYTLNQDGTFTFGDPTEVQISESVATLPKAGDVQVKVGRTLSQANLTALQAALQAIQDGIEKIESVTGVTDSDDTASNGADGKNAIPESTAPTQTSGPVPTDDDPKANTGQVDELDGKSGGAHTRVPADMAFDPEFEAAFLAALDPS